MKLALTAFCVCAVLGTLTGCGYNTMQAQKRRCSPPGQTLRLPISDAQT